MGIRYMGPAGQPHGRVSDAPWKVVWCDDDDNNDERGGLLLPATAAASGAAADDDAESDGDGATDRRAMCLVSSSEAAQGRSERSRHAADIDIEHRGADSLVSVWMQAALAPPAASPVSLPAVVGVPVASWVVL